MIKANMDIRQAAKAIPTVPLWKVAEKMGICEVTLVKRLRFELTCQQKDEIFGIIASLKEGERNG
ncbi:MAG: hypothetical protein RR115_07040 [Hydrogenoanaerobacterium sp.]